MARPTHKVVATIGKYVVNNEDKKRYMQCGVAFTDEQGRISIKLDGIPVTPDWSGFLALFPMDEDDRRPTTQQQPQKYPGDGRSERKPAAKPQQHGEDETDEIPF